MGKLNSKSHYLCSDLVTVQFTDRAGRCQRVTANLEEIAPHRLSLLLDSRIPFGSHATVEMPGLTLRGHARRAEHSSDLGWFIEVRLAPDSRWSRERFTPAHLLPSPSATSPNFCRHRPASQVNA